MGIKHKYNLYLTKEETPAANIALPKMPPERLLLILKSVQGGTSASPDRYM